MGKRFDRFKQGKFAQWFTKPANVAKLTAAGGAGAGAGAGADSGCLGSHFGFGSDLQQVET